MDRPRFSLTTTSRKSTLFNGSQYHSRNYYKVQKEAGKKDGWLSKPSALSNVRLSSRLSDDNTASVLWVSIFQILSYIYFRILRYIVYEETYLHILLDDLKKTRGQIKPGE